MVKACDVLESNCYDDAQQSRTTLYNECASAERRGGAGSSKEVSSLAVQSLH